MPISDYNISIIRKNIKNIYLRVLKDGSIQLTVPKRVSDLQAMTYLKEKEEWIDRALGKYSKRIENTKMYCGGDCFYVFGKAYKLIYTNGSTSFKMGEDTIYLSYKNDKGIDYLYSKLNALLKKEAEVYMYKYLGMLMDYGYDQIPELKYRKMTSKWGVCYSRKNSITLSSYLIHYPKECLEYVVLHEMCHFIVPNHSKRFYSLIESRIPNYKDIKKTMI